MDYAQFLNEVKTRSDRDVQEIASTYGIDFEISEIQALRPLVNEISFHWILTGIPETFIEKVQSAIGFEKTEQLFRMYLDVKR
ncbi:hypothetical protein [Sporosarcina sp. FA9]|uniref:hypothetical protein n=1 Tax=Sporosarcina sp. FA9 TaxID=3413030 RepID=UPI003F658CA9